MKNAANVLSTLRFGLALAVGIVLVFLAYWFPFLVHHCVYVIGIAAITEVLDGVCARRWPPTSSWYAKDGVEMNAWATGALCGVVPGALVVNLLFVWLIHGHALQTAWTWVGWSLLSVFFAAMTKFFEKAKAQLWPVLAEEAEVYQAYFAGFIVLSSAWVTNQISGGTQSEFWLWFMLAFAVIVGVSVFTGRLTARKDERLRGVFISNGGNNKTWRQFITQS